jgi:hypothetical protein
MSSKRARPDSQCQACGGTGYVAGAQPIRTGPYLLEPPPCTVCGARVARLNPMSERLPTAAAAASHEAEFELSAQPVAVSEMCC